MKVIILYISLILIKGACIIFIDMPDSNKAVKKQLLGSLFRVALPIVKGIVGGGGGYGGNSGKRTHVIFRSYLLIMLFIGGRYCRPSYGGRRYYGRRRYGRKKYGRKRYGRKRYGRKKYRRRG